MLDTDTKRRIDSCRDILVGKVPDPKSQVEQITIALIYKFMDDMDAEAEELNGKRTFFAGKFSQFGWARLMEVGRSGQELLMLYSEAIGSMKDNPGVPTLFRDIFKNAYLPYRDPETLRAFLKEINGFSYDHSERLGDAFEYLLSVLGAQGDAGQFRTPRHLIDFLVEVLDPQKRERVLDPACGTAGFLISAYKWILNHNKREGKPGGALTPDERQQLVKNFQGYDISPDMVRLSLANLYLHGFPNPAVEEYDTLTSEAYWNDRFDVILANPPFMSPKGGIRPHKRFAVPSNRSEVLFVDYIAEHLTAQGRAAIIVPEGVIFQSGTAYRALRKGLMRNLVAVVSLPAGVFQPYSGVKTSVLLLDNRLAPHAQEVLFVKIANDGFALGAQRREVAGSELPAAAAQLRAWFHHLRKCAIGPTTSDLSGLHLVAKSRIGENGDWNLSGERYREGEATTSEFPIVTLADVCEINPSKSELKAMALDTEVSFVPMQDIKENQIAFVAKQTKQLSDVDGKGYTYFRNNDVLLAKVTPCFENGKAGIAKNLLNGIGLGSSEFYVLRPSEKVLPEIVYYAVASSRFREAAIPQMTGTGGLQRVPSSVVKNFEISLPPLAVQQEIVAEIAGYQRVLEGARQVLAAYQPRITVLPEWPVVELGEVCKPEYGFTTSANDVGTHRFIRITDISADGYLKNEDAKYIDFVPEAQRSVVKCGDLLVARTGATFGKTMLFSSPEPAIFASFLIRLRFPEAQVLPAYYWAFAQSADYWQQANSLVTGGGQPQFNGNALVNIKFPLPDLATQQAIVAEIEAEQQLVAANKELIGRMEARIQAAIGRVWGAAVPAAGEAVLA